LLYLNIEEAKQKYFSKIGSTFCWYMMTKKNIDIETDVLCLYKKVIYKSKCNLKNMEFIPLLLTNETCSIIKKVLFGKHNKLNVETNTFLHAGIKKNRKHLSKNKSKIFKYKVIHTPSQIFYSDIKHPLQDSVKVFIPLTTYYEKILIDNCAMTQGCHFIQCKNNVDAEKIKKLLLCKLYRFIVNICRWGNFNSPRILHALPSINYLDQNKIYNEFKLSDTEINLIEKISD
jgi:hypothetical protein